MATATPSAYKATSSGILTKIPAAGAFPAPGFGTTATPVAATTAQSSTTSTGLPSGGVVPPMDFITQNNAFKTAWDRGTATGRTPDYLNGISASASANRKNFGVSDNDPVFGTEAGSYAIPDQQKQQPGGIFGALTPVPRAAPDAPAQESPTQTPAATGVAPSYNMTPDQIQAEAAAQIARRRAAMSQSVDATKTGLKNTYDYQNQIIGDRRTLENGFFQRQNSPFSGKSDYLAADLGRTRSIADTAMDKDYAAQVSAADRQLADFDTLAPEQQQALFDQLNRIERDYGIQVGTLTGTFGDQKTLAARTADQNYQLGLGGLTGNINGQKTVQQKQLDWNMDPSNPNNEGQIISNEISKLKLQNLPQELKANLDILDQQVKSGAISLEQAQYTLNELKDPNSVTNQSNAIKLELSKIDLANAPTEARLRIEKLTKDIAEIGKAPYRTPEEVQMAKVKLATMNEELSQLKNKPNAADPQLNSELQGLYTGLSTGKINALDASREVDQRVSMGLITPNAAATMKSFIQKFEESATSQPGQGGYKFQSSPNDLVSMTPTQLLSAWETDPTGKVAGRAMYDWRSWVTDPKGYKAGLSYELWHSKYGPKLGG